MTLTSNQEIEIFCPACGSPTKAGHTSTCPLGKNPEDANLLRETVYNLEAQKQRMENFENIWQNRWQSKGGGKQSFQTETNESPFSNYSSKGWKIHIAFTKGEEKTITRTLYSLGLYFKVEAGIGTYFNGAQESGSTIYIVSKNNMETIAQLIDNRLRLYLKDGATAQTSRGKIRMGSGSDIEILPKITARFDIAKTPLGWHSGNGKYAEHGLPSWTGLGGIPILKKFETEVATVESNWNKYLDSQRQIYLDRSFKPAYEESKKELVKDFGEEFVLGS